MRSNYYVYGLFAKNRPISIFYIGKGTKNRMYRHNKEEPKDTHKRRILNKYHCYPMFIIGGITETFAYALEEKLVDLYKSVLANKQAGGTAPKNRVLSKRTKALCRNSVLGRKHSSAAKEKIRQARKNQVIPKGADSPNYGKKHYVSLDDKRRTKKLNLDFIRYNFWAYEISNLSLINYCRLKQFSAGTFKSWRTKLYREYAKPVSKHKIK